MLFELAFFNGQWKNIKDCQLSPFDRGFMFADSCYEVIPVYQKKILLLKKHIERLTYGLTALSINNPYTDQQWMEICQRLADLSEGKSYIYLQITRGTAQSRQQTTEEDLQPTIFAYSEKTPNNIQPKALSVELIEDFRWHRCDIKVTALTASVIAKQNSLANGYDEVLFHRDGCLSECSASNIFVVHENVIKTPPCSNKLLAGITRTAVIDLLKEHNIAYAIEEIPLANLNAISEIWLSSSVKELIPISHINHKPVAQEAISKKFSKVWKLWQKKYYIDIL